MDLEKQKLEIKGALEHFYRNASKDDYLQALENAIEEIQNIKNINYTRCYVSEAVQLVCSTCGSKDLCASCMRMPIETIQDKIKNNCT